eukprot:349991-Pyramimonas_sp.AAC.1
MRMRRRRKGRKNRRRVEEEEEEDPPWARRQTSPDGDFCLLRGCSRGIGVPARGRSEEGAGQGGRNRTRRRGWFEVVEKEQKEGMRQNEQDQEDGGRKRRTRRSKGRRRSRRRMRSRRMMRG